MEVVKLPVGQLQSNCYIVWQTGEEDCVIIDPGDDADFIIRRINDLGLNPSQIVATHGHFDHVLAALELQLAFNIPFLIHEKDQFLLDRQRDTALHFTKVDAGPPPMKIQYIKEGTKLLLRNMTMQILHTPGHTPGSICLYSEQDDKIFVGDLIFSGGGVGRTDLSYANPVDLSKSIKKILDLPEQTVIYPGHGDETIVANERMYH